MSANHQTIIKKMSAACIMPVALKTTLEIEEQTSLREIIANREFEIEDGLQSYIVHAGDSKLGGEVAIIVNVIAKELILSNVPVRVTSFSAIAREIRMEQARPDYEPEILEHRGNGYIVIDSANAYANIAADNWEEVTEWLCSHIHRGGGLIFGASIWVAADQTQFGDHFAGLAKQFKKLQIKIR